MDQDKLRARIQTHKGKPAVGMKTSNPVFVEQVITLILRGHTEEFILKHFNQLEHEDLQACKLYIVGNKSTEEKSPKIMQEESEQTQPPIQLPDNLLSEQKRLLRRITIGKDGKPYLTDCNLYVDSILARMASGTSPVRLTKNNPLFREIDAAACIIYANWGLKALSYLQQLKQAPQDMKIPPPNWNEIDAQNRKQLALIKDKMKNWPNTVQFNYNFWIIVH